MTTLHIEVSDELSSQLQREASERKTSLEAVARQFLRLKTEEVEAQRAIFQDELQTAWRNFNDAKARDEKEEKLAELDDAIDEVWDKIDVFELDLRGAAPLEDCVSWNDVKLQLRARKDDTEKSAQ